MKLSLRDRIILPEILPKKSSFEKLIIVNDITAKLMITQEETRIFEIKTTTNEKGGTAITWNAQGDDERFEINFSESESLLIAECLKKMSRGEELTRDHVSLYKLFLTSN